MTSPNNEKEVKQMNNNNPLDNLAEMLKNAEIPYELVYSPFTKSDVLIYPNRKERIADAIYSLGQLWLDDEVESSVSTEEAFLRIKKLWESDNK